MATTISRREMLQRATLAAGLAIAPGWLESAVRAQAVAQTDGRATYLSPDELALVTAAAERILPRTDTPGATDVGVPAFLDVFYGEFMSPGEQATFRRILNALAANTFLSQSPEGQDAFLKGYADREAEAGDAAEGGPNAQPSSFALLRSMVILGYFTSEEVGRNVLHYDPIPGRYDACVPIDEVGNRNWTT